MDTVISQYNDLNNIYHILTKEASVLFKLKEDGYEKLYLQENNKSCCNDWRRILYSTIFEILPTKPQDAYVLTNKSCKNTLYDTFKFDKNVKINSNFVKYINLIKKNITIIDITAPKIVLSLRHSSRVLHDLDTGQRIDNMFKTKFGESSVIYFEELTPLEQMIKLQNCEIFIGVHGANMVNLIFTKPNSKIIEISFRKNWFCDPVCKDHLCGKINWGQKCNGKLTKRPYYHKADYHNLSLMLGKKYIEIDDIICDHYINKNPINVNKVFISFEKLCEQILN